MVKDVRQYILCCIVENVNLNDGKFREFLQIQTKLHETVCAKREKSTIATHDLSKIPRPAAATDAYIVRYTAKDANSLKIHPLGKTKLVTAQELYNELKAEADALRKQKQRNTYSGIHKYLKLLENQTQFSCVEDGLGNVISLPPLTNGESTKVSTCHLSNIVKSVIFLVEKPNYLKNVFQFNKFNKFMLIYTSNLTVRFHQKVPKSSSR